MRSPEPPCLSDGKVSLRRNQALYGDKLALSSEDQPASAFPVLELKKPILNGPHSVMARALLAYDLSILLTILEHGNIYATKPPQIGT